MFKKLKNRFLLLNLVTISVMMLVAFAAIYAITYQDVRRDIGMELHKTSEFYYNPHGNVGKQRSGPDEEYKNMPGDPPMESGYGGPPPGRTVSFMLLADPSGAISVTESRFDMEAAFYEEALEKALESGNDAGQFALDGNDWAFSAQAAASGTMFVFMDVTAQQGILTNLIYTFVAVGLGMLIVIYFISRFFASRSIAPVKEAFEKQKQFIADASHELKTPLAVIQTNTDVLLANREDTIESQAKWLHYIKHETERMAKLTNDLLYLTEMDDSRAAMLFSEFNLSDAAETVILTMEAVIFEKRLRLDYDIEPGLTVNGSSEQLKQVMMILLDNAIKYTNAEGSISISLKKQHHDVVLSVSNTGEGIAPEHLNRIFDRFYRTDASRTRKQGGHGLGLAIAKSIVEQHGGKLYARSTVGETTTFFLHLPMH
ncbi:HAMP domain-containing sensor histidine kinase [Paenibacillus sp. LHD-117]|uniref:sensor histidine kinase n=1 Tax=Paenibacillus sp. LHD-117 TaxID=3071412 RepID=UPI0027E0F84A|nr:HAMP domain-containing sensor histidine kinase [Paenibacillus sp. LHD-117]MDQ6423437.1 HAMP domain-containing sensor histidine kinase [Paenibacillus sp. LHD-117]